MGDSRVKCHFGQQTPCHASTQTPVLVRLDAKGRLWMSDDALSTASLFRNLCIEDSRPTLGSCFDHRTQQLSHSNAETQTTNGNHGDRILDYRSEDAGRNVETREKLEPKQTQKRGDNRERKIKDDDVAAKENGKQVDPVDESRKQLLQLMLREIKHLRKNAAEMKLRSTLERERNRHADKDGVKHPRLDNTKKKHAANRIVFSKENARRDEYSQIDKGYHRNFQNEIRRRKPRRDAGFRHRRSALPESGGHSGVRGSRRRGSISEAVGPGQRVPDSPTGYPGGPSDLDLYRRNDLDVKSGRRQKTSDRRHFERR